LDHDKFKQNKKDFSNFIFLENMSNYKIVNMYIKKIIVLILFLMSVFPSCLEDASRHSISVQEGNLDLSSFTSWEDARIELDGTWEFYPDYFLSPGETNAAVSFFQVPGFWNGQTVNGRQLKPFGYASYRLNLDGLPEGSYGIHVIDLETSYALYINGILLGKNGLPGKNAQSSIPEWKPETYYFSVDQGSRTEIILHVSNFHHRLGGIWDSLTIGKADVMKKRWLWKNFFEVFIVGAIFISVIFHLQLFFFRRTEYPYLFFSVAWTSFGIRTLVTGERFLLQIVDIPWELFVKIDYLSATTAYCSFHFFLYFSNPNKYDKKFIFAILAFLLGMIFLVISTRVYYFSHILLTQNLIMFVFSIYWLYSSFKSYRAGIEGFGAILLGGSVLTVLGINDALYNHSFLQTENLLQYGSFFFLLSQVYFLSIRYDTAFKRSEKLSSNISRLLNTTRNLSGLTEIKDVITNAVEQIVKDLSLKKSHACFFINDIKNARWNQYQFSEQGDFSERICEDEQSHLLSEIKEIVKKDNRFYFPVQYQNQVHIVLQIDSSGLDLNQDDIDFISGTAMSVGPLISSLKKQEKSKLEAVGLLASEIVHDIRNRLQTIFSSVDFYKNNKEESKDAEATIDQIEKQSKLLNYMSQDILDYTNDQMMLFKEKTELETYVKQILDEFRKYSEEEEVQVNYMVNQKVSVNIDQDRLYRAIFNLLKNSAEAMSGNINKMIDVQTGMEDDIFYIVIQDNGKGISQNLLPRLFTPFAGSGKKKGTGLGLAAVQRIVKGHGGVIAVVSGDNGTRFTVKIPLT